MMKNLKLIAVSTNEKKTEVCVCTYNYAAVYINEPIPIIIRNTDLCVVDYDIKKKFDCSIDSQFLLPLEWIEKKSTHDIKQAPVKIELRELLDEEHQLDELEMQSNILMASDLYNKCSICTSLNSGSFCAMQTVQAMLNILKNGWNIIR